MRTNLLFTLVLLAVLLTGGVAAENAVHNASRRYVAAAEELRVMSLEHQWRRTADTAQAYAQAWKRCAATMRMLIDHQDVDAIALALERIRAGAEAGEYALCLEGCAELKSFAELLYSRGAFTLGNIL